MTGYESEEYCRRQAHCTQEENSRWWPEQVPTKTNGAFLAPHQGTIPVVKVGNGHDNIYQKLLLENKKRLLMGRPDSLNLPVEGYGQRQSLGTRPERREYLRYESAEEPRRLQEMGVGAQPYYNQVLRQRLLSLSVPSQLKNYLLPQVFPDARDQQEVEQRKLAQQRRHEQKHEQEKPMLPAANPGNLYPRPSRMSGPVRTVHDDDMERRTMSNRTFSTHLHPSELLYYRLYPERLKKDHESVKQLLSSVNKALEQKVEAAELQAADTEFLQSEAPRVQSQQLQQDQNDANQAAREFGESFWGEYSANHPTAGCSSVPTPLSQEAASPSARPPIADPGFWKGEVDLADRIRDCLGRSQSEHSQKMSDCRPATGAIDMVPGDLLQSPSTTSGQLEPSALRPPPVVSTSPNSEKPVPFATLPLSSAIMSKEHASSQPISQAKETNIGPELRADDQKAEKARGAVLLGDLDTELEWEEMDDESEDEEWTDVDDARRESLDVEWASEGAFDY